MFLIPFCQIQFHLVVCLEIKELQHRNIVSVLDVSCDHLEEPIAEHSHACEGLVQSMSN